MLVSNSSPQGWLLNPSLTIMIARIMRLFLFATKDELGDKSGDKSSSLRNSKHGFDPLIVFVL